MKYNLFDLYILQLFLIENIYEGKGSLKAQTLNLHINIFRAFILAFVRPKMFCFSYWSQLNFLVLFYPEIKISFKTNQMLKGLKTMGNLLSFYCQFFVT
jgi:hypothetical protein